MCMLQMQKSVQDSLKYKTPPPPQVFKLDMKWLIIRVKFEYDV